MTGLHENIHLPSAVITKSQNDSSSRTRRRLVNIGDRLDTMLTLINLITERLNTISRLSLAGPEPESELGVFLDRLPVWKAAFDETKTYLAYSLHVPRCLQRKLNAVVILAEDVDFLFQQVTSQLARRDSKKGSKSRRRNQEVRDEGQYRPHKDLRSRPIRRSIKAEHKEEYYLHNDTDRRQRRQNRRSLQNEPRTSL